MLAETKVTEFNEDDDIILEGIVDFDDDISPYSVTLGDENWVSEATLNKIIKTLQRMKRIRKAGVVK